MGILFGVQPPIIEGDTELHSLRTGSDGSEVLWFKAIDLPSGLSVQADEIPGKPGVMSHQKASGEPGKYRLVTKLAAVVKEMT